ncbi:Stf0 family sulfotransferase [Salinibacter ruber]|uniref:Stf0 family sulfotransferase n=1 Tax=Salinibacter ruber TaxID=146919 RepID=UPI0020741AE5|nr:Stf0 family sulfotransferase [Salinibacter ruber]
MLFAQGRTGSTLLGELLNSHPEIDFEHEILNIDREWDDPYAYPYLYSLGRRKISDALSYGYHVKIYQLWQDLDDSVPVGQNSGESLPNHSTDPAGYLHQAHADGWNLVYLKRENLLRHALSSIRAEASGEYHQRADEDEDSPKSLNPVRVDPIDLIKKMEWREEKLAQEQEALSTLPHLEISYGSDLVDENRHQATAERIFRFLGLEANGIQVSTQLERINQGSLPELIRNYDEVASSLEGTRFDRFLEK